MKLLKHFKKVMIILSIFSLALTLMSCRDRKSFDNRVNVIFFTANTDATHIESIFDVEPGTKISKPEETPERVGYVFTGWYANKEWTVPWDFDNDVTLDKSFVIYAGWSASGYTISYNLNNGTLDKSPILEYVSGDRVVFPTPKRTGYKFTGWFLYDQNISGTKPGDKPTPSTAGLSKNIEVFAHWQANESIVKFNSNYPSTPAITNPAQIVCIYDKVISGLITLEDTSTYTFVGWNTKQDGSGKWYVNGDVWKESQNVTLYGQWTLK
jgi:uncharacterized repeat protein (TIGR02543 family)